MNEFINRFCTDVDFFYDTLAVIFVFIFALAMLRRWR